MGSSKVLEMGRYELIDLVDELRDAAEFEARVAEKIAFNHTHYTCTGSPLCSRFVWDKSKGQCRYVVENCVLWKARLSVEREIDTEGHKFYEKDGKDITHSLKVDLTVMFGEGNEPSPEECKKLFATHKYEADCKVGVWTKTLS